MKRKAEHLVNLVTAIDLIWELGSQGKIDRETESIFIETLYKAREFRFKKNPYKTLKVNDNGFVWDMKEYLEIKIEAFKKLFLKIESIADRSHIIMDEDKANNRIQNLIKARLGLISAEVLKTREILIELANLPDNDARLEAIRHHLENEHYPTFK